MTKNGFTKVLSTMWRVQRNCVSFSVMAMICSAPQSAPAPFKLYDLNGPLEKLYICIHRECGGIFEDHWKTNVEVGSGMRRGIEVELMRKIDRSRWNCSAFRLQTKNWNCHLLTLLTRSMLNLKAINLNNRMLEKFPWKISERCVQCQLIIKNFLHDLRIERRFGENGVPQPRMLPQCEFIKTDLSLVYQAEAFAWVQEAVPLGLRLKISSR